MQAVRLLTLLALPTLVSCKAQTPPDVTMSIISDLHVAPGATSERIFAEAAMPRIATAAPDLLLVTGDLTERGDLQSHQQVAQSLAQQEANGKTRVYVIPGNHDLYGQAVSREEFAQVYADFGYDEAILRHDQSLSYLAYPAEGLALLCLDTTREPDGNRRHSDGGIDLPLLDWAEQAAATARQDGRRVIGLMHHELMEHFDRQSLLAQNYVANGDTLRYPSLATVHERLTQAGVHLMFTGHFHIQSIQHVQTTAGELYDVSTGSLANYPSPIRTATLTGLGQLTLTSDTVAMAHDEQLQRNSAIVHSILQRGVARLFPMMSRVQGSLPTRIRQMIQLPATADEMLADLTQYMQPALTDVYNAMALGDEDQHDPDLLYRATYEALNAYTVHVCKGNQMMAAFLTEGMSNPAASDELPASPDENYMALADSVLRSILYNYCGAPTNVVADATLTLQLP